MKASGTANGTASAKASAGGGGEGEGEGEAEAEAEGEGEGEGLRLEAGAGSDRLERTGVDGAVRVGVEVSKKLLQTHLPSLRAEALAKRLQDLGLELGVVIEVEAHLQRDA